MNVRSWLLEAGIRSVARGGLRVTLPKPFADMTGKFPGHRTYSRRGEPKVDMEDRQRREATVVEGHQAI
ncbi:MAG TPA: hypothetical protein VFR30_08355, partial [Lysobacter sp.]|nr:hypothetical protein [Lysobacter sp.]